MSVLLQQSSIDTSRHWMMILIIDDDPMIRETIRRMFMRTSFTILTAATADEGLALLTNHCPAIVVTDLFMPDKDGLETIAEIRAVDDEVFIIAMSGGSRHGQSNLLNAALTFGADALLDKPFRFEQFDALIHHALDQAEAQFETVT